MKEYKHLGAYGIIIKNNKILLIKKNGGLYDGKLDLPGGTIEFGEKPEEALKREILEEVGIIVTNSKLHDVNSVCFDWKEENTQLKVHHIGIFYKILAFDNEIKKQMNLDSQNDDSLGADFYVINKLNKKNLSAIAILELEKLGYEIK